MSISAKAVNGISMWPAGTAEVGTRGNWDSAEGYGTVEEAISAGVIGVCGTRIEGGRSPMGSLICFLLRLKMLLDGTSDALKLLPPLSDRVALNTLALLFIRLASLDFVWEYVLKSELVEAAVWEGSGATN
jgi:hypothetical protein